MRWVLILAVGLLTGGCADRVKETAANADPAADAPQLADQAAPPPGGAADAPQADAPPEAPKLIPITKREARLVDKKKAMQENPALVEVENKINASDPLTAVAQSYFTIGSRAQVLAMQHNIELQKALNDRWPTFEEFQKQLQQAGVKLQGLYAYQMYAYDEETGGMSILEDRAEMKKQYEAAGRDYPYND